MRKIDPDILAPIALTIFFAILAIVIIAADYAGTYEYETVDGEKGTAAHCGCPYRGVPYCRLDDGTEVYGIKEYRRTPKEKE